MNAETIRESLKRTPFEPIELHMTSGEQHQSRRPENGWLAGSRLVLYYPESDRLDILSLLHIATIEMLKAAA